MSNLQALRGFGPLPLCRGLPFGRVLRPRGLHGCWIRNCDLTSVDRNIEQPMSLIVVRDAAGAIRRTPMRSKLLMIENWLQP